MFLRPTQPYNRLRSANNRGAALILSMIFVLVFSALAVSLATLSGTNVQIANNQHKINSAFGSAESGLEIMRYWLNRVRIPNSTAPSAIFSTVAASLQSDLTSNGISNITANYDGSQITIPSVTLVSTDNTSFSAILRQLDNDTLQLDVTGTNGQIRRTIRVNYNIEPYQYPIFDYGLATKGPLHINGNPSLTGINDPQEASIYIESQNDDLALVIKGNSDIAGDISIAKPNAQVQLQGNVSIGGETGQAAIDNHIFINADTIEFPVPNPGHFQQYAIVDIIDSSTDTSGNMTITNAIVSAGTDPIFSGNVQINGILFIESPNKVKFAGNLTMTGLIVANGDVDSPSPDNELTFGGNVHTYPVSQLPEELQFEQLRQETGSLILAPGFSVSFQGNFSMLDGIIAASGTEFFGNANGTIKGSVINYADTPMVLKGNANLHFDRSANIKVPAGFDTTRVLQYDPSSYSEINL